MTPEEAAKKFAEAAKRLPQAIQEAERESLRELKAAAVARSQGPLRPADLRRMGHPYARRSLRLNPNIINKVSGEFAAGWATEGPKAEGGRIVSRLFNRTVKARGLEKGLVFGRSVMAPRGPHTAAFEEIRERRMARLTKVWDEVFD